MNRIICFDAFYLRLLQKIRFGLPGQARRRARFSALAMDVGRNFVRCYRHDVYAG